LVVWVPFLGGSRGAINPSVLPDSRVTSLWDQNAVSSQWFSRHVTNQPRPTWDYYLLFPPKARWGAVHRRVLRAHRGGGAARDGAGRGGGRRGRRRAPRRRARRGRARPARRDRGRAARPRQRGAHDHGPPAGGGVQVRPRVAGIPPGPPPGAAPRRPGAPPPGP